MGFAKSQMMPAVDLNEMQCLINLIKTKEMVEGINKKYKIDPARRQLPEVRCSHFSNFIFSYSKNRRYLFTIKT